ncbi:MAG: LIC_13355 family lipoprotein [Myxococcales bacterium]|nr:LIC_13355 family lipoprotein [Myxococcales bacterium]
MRADRLALCFFVSSTLGACDGAAFTPTAADTIVEATGASDAPFHDPSRALDGVQGAGHGAGSLDVYSIDYGTHLVLGWAGRRVVDGPGAELVVFENPFTFGDGRTFMDPTIVEVSIDGASWVAFPHDYLAQDETLYSSDADDWVGFAGVTPVLLHDETNPVDPFDAAAAGGDAFDIATLPTEGLGGRVREEGFAFVRLSAAADHVNPDTGDRYPRDPVANGPDIDGVIARHLVDE